MKLWVRAYWPPCIFKFKKIQTFILFAFKLLTLTDKTDEMIWSNPTPNSPFVARPIALIAQAENFDSVKFTMENFVNSETQMLQSQGFDLQQGHIHVVILRSMFDCKISGLLSGAGGAKCQLCTAIALQLRHLDLVRGGFPINRHVEDAKYIFNGVNIDDF